MSLTVRELLLMHTRGISPDVMEREEQWFEEMEVPQIQDLTDLENYNRKLTEWRNQLQEQVKDEMQQAVLQKEKEKQEALNKHLQDIQPLHKTQNEQQQLNETM